MAFPDRKTVREKYAELITLVLVGTGLQTQEVYPYLPDDFGQLKAVVCVISDGTERPSTGKNGLDRATFRLRVLTFVLANNDENTYTDQQTEDTLDEIDTIIGQFNKTNYILKNYWHSIIQQGMSGAQFVQIGGDDYRREERFLDLEVY